MELAIGTIVVIAIAVLVVLVLVGYFLGSFGKSGSALSGISDQGAKGVGDINVELKCIGSSRMTDKDCAAIGVKTTLCTGGGQNSKVETGTDCSSITDANECSDYAKAKGCHWGVTQ